MAAGKDKRKPISGRGRLAYGKAGRGGSSGRGRGGRPSFGSRAAQNDSDDDRVVGDEDDEEIESSDSEESNVGTGQIEDMNLEHEWSSVSEGESTDEETATARRVRQAKEYIASLRDQIEKDEEGDLDAAEIDRDLVAQRLADDSLKLQGRLYTCIADQLDMKPVEKCFGSAHKRPITAAVLSPKGDVLYTAGKDCAIIKWDVATGKRLWRFRRQTRAGLATDIPTM